MLSDGAMLGHLRFWANLTDETEGSLTSEKGVNISREGEVP